MIASAVLLAALAGAQAADMSTKAPAAAAAPSYGYSWTGFYVGAHVGGAVNSGDASVATSAGDSTGAIGGTPGSFVAGVGGGFDYQVNSMFVLGVFADQDFSWLNRSTSGVLPGSVFNLNDASHYNGAAGGRVGVLLDPALMAYGKAGFAWAGAHPDFAALGTSKAISDTSGGWEVGGGLEWRLAKNWSFKVEYDRIQTGDRQIGITNTAGTATFTSSTKYTIDQGTAGITYRF